MLKRDFLMRQIGELTELLIGSLLNPDELLARKIDVMGILPELTGLKESEITSLSSEEIISRLKDENLGLEKIESISLALFYFFETGQKDSLPLKTSYELMQYIDQNSDCFSFERKDFLKRMESQMDN